MKWDLQDDGQAKICLESWEEIESLCKLCKCKSLFDVKNKVLGLNEKKVVK